MTHITVHKASSLKTQLWNVILFKMHSMQCFVIVKRHAILNSHNSLANDILHFKKILLQNI